METDKKLAIKTGNHLIMQKDFQRILYIESLE